MLAEYRIIIIDNTRIKNKTKELRNYRINTKYSRSANRLTLINRNNQRPYNQHDFEKDLVKLMQDNLILNNDKNKKGRKIKINLTKAFLV